MSSHGKTALDSGLTGCQTCFRLVPASERRCPQCHSRIEARIPNSLQRTLGLTIAASILYIPANVLPITKTVYLGNTTNSTIMGGVITLWEHGSYGIAAVILIASVMVPLAKLIILFYLCFATSRKVVRNPHQCASLYRLTELIGRWSMIDVFVVAVLVALVQLGNIISFYPGFAALSFAAVVIITMFAAEQFDARLIWDSSEE